MKALYAYIRVSTAKQGQRGVSLPEQRRAIEEYAARNSLLIGRWFEERQSAAVQGRPRFDEMLRELQLHQAAGVIMHKIDRTARNLGDWNEVTELLDRGFDVHVAHDAIDLRSRSGRLMGDIQAVLAADYSRNLREEVRKGIRGRLQQGLLPRPAPVGYCNEGSGRPKTIDPVAGPLVRDLFERYSSGRYSLRSLSREAVSMGLRGRSGKPLRPMQIGELLHNPFYTGVIWIKRTGQTFQGVHLPLITRATFERVQRVLSGKAPRGALKHDFLFRRLLRCGTCRLRLVGERQKGRVYYRCHTTECPTTTVREDVAEAEFLHLIADIRISLLGKKAVHEVLDELAGDAEKHDKAVQEGLNLRLMQLKSRLARLTDAYVDGGLDRREFAERKMALLAERQDLERRTSGGQKADMSRAAITEILELAEHSTVLYQHASLTERRELIELLTSNRLVEGRTPQFTLASPFDELTRSGKLHSGGPRRDTARTRATARRMFEAVTKFVATGGDDMIGAKVHELLQRRGEPQRQAA